MRVLVTTSTYPLPYHEYWGNFISDLNRRLMKRGITTITVVPRCRFTNRTSSPGLLVREFTYVLRKYQILGCPPGLEQNSRLLLGRIQLPLYSLAFLIHVLKNTLQNKPQVIHANWAIPAGLISLIVGKFTRTPVIVTVHGADAYQKGFYRSVVRFVLEKVDHVVAVSNHIRRKILAFTTPKNLTVIPNVVDGKTIRDSKAQMDLEKIRGKYSIKTEDKVVLTVRRLVSEKRVKDLIEAAQIVLTKFPNVVFIIAGSGPELSELKQITQNLNIESRVRFLGTITEMEKLELYSIADVFVHTSVQEGLSLALLEAMAAETIVVASAAAGQSDTIKHGITGLLFKPTNIQSLAKQMERALSDPKLLSIPKKAADFVIAGHSSEGHTQGYIKIYSEFSKDEK